MIGRALLATVIFTTAASSMTIADTVAGGAGTLSCAQFAKDYQQSPSVSENAYFSWAQGLFRIDYCRIASTQHWRKINRISEIVFTLILQRKAS